MAKYDVLSPDGFSIEFGKTYDSIDEAKKAFKTWKKRYKTQGYYSCRGEQIPLKYLEEYCTLQEL